MDKKIITGAGIILIALMGFMFFNKGSITGNVIAEPIDEGNSIKIPLSSISKNAHWFDYNSEGVNIKYFVVRDGDGNVKSAFDACDVCYKTRKGYRQEGGDMICNNCGNHYPISGIGTANLRGGCWPGYLQSSIQGDYLVISKQALEVGRYRFA